MAAKKKTYAELLRDPRWQKLRLKIMERDGFRCVVCDDDKNTLNVHHSYYARGCKPWEYDESALITLCQRCHGLLSLFFDYFRVFLVRRLNPEEGGQAFLTATDHVVPALDFSECVTKAGNDAIFAATTQLRREGDVA